jgi:hypothetical protein
MVARHALVQMSSLLFWLAPALDPRRCNRVLRRLKQPGLVQIAFKEPAQIFRAAHPELGGLAVNGGLHLRRAAKGEGYVGPVIGFFDSHLAQLLSDLVQWHWPLFNQDRTNISKIDIGGAVTFKDHEVPGIRREVYPFGPGYSDQSAATGFNQERPKRAKGDLFVNLFNHTRQ